MNIKLNKLKLSEKKVYRPPRMIGKVIKVYNKYKSEVDIEIVGRFAT